MVSSAWRRTPERFRRGFGGIRTGFHGLKYLVSFILRFSGLYELWAILLPEITTKDNRQYAISLGRWRSSPREGLLLSLRRGKIDGLGKRHDSGSGVIGGY
jgi:hypothetical protein